MTRLEELRARFRANQAVQAKVRRGNPYLPHDLHPKQLEFLNLPQREALFGGAAGGGKTDALLGGALVYATRPRFSALILRRTFPSLRLRGSIMDRAREWLQPTDAHWEGDNSRWRFPSGATLQFGYCDADTDLDRYKSAEFHYIAIDELTEWPKGWYEFLFSRLRRLKGDDTPIKMRAASNPDGIGAEWVRQRFGIPLNEVVDKPLVSGDRAFLPARAEDNPSLDLEEYEKSLEQMTGSRTSARYQQLRFGRWMRSLEGLVYAYSEERNAISQAPTCKFTVLGIDYGTTKATSFNVLGWNENDPTVYILESFKFTDLIPSEAAELVVGLEGIYHFHKIVGDVGGLGKGYSVEARQRFHMPVEPAQKNNKRGYIKLFNGELERQRIKVVKPQCLPLIGEWLELPWDPKREVAASGFENHCADGTLYAWRATTAHHANEDDAPAPKGSREALLQEEKRIEQAALDELEGEERDMKRGRWWRALGKK